MTEKFSCCCGATELNVPGFGGICSDCHDHTDFFYPCGGCGELIKEDKPFYWQSDGPYHGECLEIDVENQR